MLSQKQRESARVELVKIWYEQTGYTDGWTIDRISRLCRLIGCTLPELSAIVGLKSDIIRRHFRLGTTPKHLSLLLTMIETSTMELKLGQRPRIVLPLHIIHGEQDDKASSPG